jgi:hypothetical protein
MEPLNAANYGNRAIGSMQGGQISAAQVPKQQPTVASALGRMDHLNDRLAGISGQLAAIANAVGSPYPANSVPGETPQPNGMVYRLNDSADNAHRQAGEIEELIGAISRALG